MSIIDKEAVLVVRRTVNSSLVLLLLLLAGVAVVAAVGAGSARDLFHRSVSSPGTDGLAITYRMTVSGPDASPSVEQATPVQWWAVIPHAVGDAQVIDDRPHSQTTGLLTPGARPVAWLLWTALPSAIVILALLALMLASVVTARRRGLYAPRTLRLLRITGFVGLAGGPAAALVETLVGTRLAGPNTYTPAVGRWQLAAVLVLLGCAFLAVREVLGRTAELGAELEGVI
jgi:hypothetical protein